LATSHFDGIFRIGWFRFVLFLVALVSFALVVTVAGGRFLSVGERLDKWQGDGSWTPRPSQGRLLVILLDGMRQDFAFSERAPFIFSCRERGAWGTSEVVSLPLSIAGQRAIFSGSIANPLSIFHDYKAPAESSPNVFMRVKERGKHAVIFDAFMLGAYGVYSDASVFRHKVFRFGEYRQLADDTFTQASAFIKKEKWDLAVVPFYTLDYAGHLETSRSPQYAEMVTLVDGYVRRLVELTDKNDIVLITSEHGMNDHGFHTDRSSAVIDTAFVLLGKGIRKGGPMKVLQIDWAPTLSILVGVSPFYPSLAVPALDTLQLPEEEKTRLVRAFSKVLGGGDLKSLDDLRRERNKLLVGRPSPASGLFAGGLTLLAVTLLGFLVLSSAQSEECHRTRGGVLRPVPGVAVSVFIVCAAAAFLSRSGLLEWFPQNFPFRAGHIIAHPLRVGLLFAASVALGMIVSRCCGTLRACFTNSSPQGGAAAEGRFAIAALLLLALVLSTVFVASQPYHLLNWAVLCAPLVAWGATRRRGWLVFFGATWIGLAIRRLTLVSAYSAVNLPDRWMIGAGVVVLTLVYVWILLRKEASVRKRVVSGALAALPSLAAMAVPAPIEVRSVLLLLCFLPIAVLARGRSRDVVVWPALWVTLYCLGTSSSIHHATHIAALPLLVAAGSIAARSSEAIKGLLVSLGVWILYLLPGNYFVLNLTELGDKFILHSAVTENIGITVAVIAARHILPATVLVWCVGASHSRSVALSSAAAALLPVVCGAGVRLALLVSVPQAGFPFEQFISIGVEIGYVVAVLIAFGAAVAASLPARLAVEGVERIPA